MPFHVTTILVTASLYAIPKIFDLCQKDADFRKLTSFVTTALKDNLWIAYLSLQCVIGINGNPLFTNLSYLVQDSVAVFALSQVLHVIRSITAKLIPAIGRYIGPSKMPL
jgi:hypothetical protein